MRHIQRQELDEERHFETHRDGEKQIETHKESGKDRKRQEKTD